MNYWVMALYFKWVTPELVKQAVELGDCSMEDLKTGYEQKSAYSRAKCKKWNQASKQGSETEWK
ncbi:hypothetical protein ACEQPO_23175 [Bacillus sp. SL00103]